MARPRQTDPFLAVMGAHRGVLTAGALYSATLTAAGEATVEYVLEAARNGNLAPAFEFLADHWSKIAPPAQTLLQERLPSAVWEWTVNAHAQTAVVWSNMLSDSGVINITATRVRASEPTKLAVIAALTATFLRETPVDQRALAGVLTAPNGFASNNFARTVSMIYRAAFTDAAAAAAYADGPDLLTKLLPSKRQRIDEYKDEVPVSDSELLAILGVDGYGRVFEQLLPQAQTRVDTGGPAQAQGALSRLLNMECSSLFEHHYRKQIKEARRARKAVLARHPAVEAADLARDLMAEQGLNTEELALQAGLTMSMVHKMTMRSARPRSGGNSGRIASMETTKKFCNALGVDWAAVQLATLTVELPGAKRRTDGRLHGTRYEVVGECLQRLRAAGVDSAILDVIRAHADGKIIIAADERDLSWQEPYRQLLARERAQQLSLC